MCKFQISDVQMILSEPEFLGLIELTEFQNSKNSTNSKNSGSENNLHINFYLYPSKSF